MTENQRYMRRQCDKSTPGSDYRCDGEVPAYKQQSHQTVCQKAHSHILAGSSSYTIIYNNKLCLAAENESDESGDKVYVVPGGVPANDICVYCDGEPRDLHNKTPTKYTTMPSQITCTCMQF